MQLPERIRRQFQEWGREGGRARTRTTSAPARRAIARIASIRRWTKERFGSSRFEDLGLPGGAMIDQGLEDLAREKETLESLMVALASPRLRREGVPVPKVPIPDADHRLYQLIEKQEGELAHARYLARLRQVTSFADACRIMRARED